MAGRQFRTDLVIGGDASGAVGATRATHDELGRLIRQQGTAESSTRRYGSAVADASRHQQRMSDTSDTATSSLMGWASVAAGAAVAAASALAISQAQAAKETQIMADALGMSAGQMSEFAYAAKYQGVEAGESMAMLKDLAEKVGEAVKFDSGEGKEALEELGLSAEKLVKKSPVDMLLDISAAIDQMDTEAEKSAVLEMLASDLTVLLPLLRDGAAGYRELVQQGHDLNVILSDTDISGMAEMADSFERLGDAVTGQINMHIAPALSAMANAVVDNMGSIVSAIEIAKYGVVGFATVYIAQSVAARIEDGKSVLARRAAVVAELRLASARDASAATAARASAQTAVAEVQSYRLVVESTRAEIAREQVRLRAQISAEGRRQAVNRLAAARGQLAAATAALTRVEAQHTAAVASSTVAQNAAAASSLRLASATTVAGLASRGLRGVLALFGGPWGLAAVVGIAAIAGAFYLLKQRAEATANELERVTALADAAKAKAAEPETMQLNLESEEKALAALQAKVAETERSMARIRTQLDAGGLPTATVVALSETYATLQTAVAGAGDQIKSHHEEIARLKSGLQAAGVEVEGTVGRTDEQAAAVAKLIAQLKDQERQLDLTGQQMLAYKLSQQNATDDEIARAMAIYKSIEAIKARKKAEAEAEKAAKSAAAEAERAAEAYQTWLEKVKDAADPARKLSEEIEKINAAVTSGDLTEAQGEAYIKKLKEGFKKSAEAGEEFGKSFVDAADLGGALAESIMSGDFSALGNVLGSSLGGAASDAISGSLSGAIGSTAGGILGGVGGSLVGSLVSGVFAGSTTEMTGEGYRLGIESGALFSAEFSKSFKKSSMFSSKSWTSYSDMLLSEFDVVSNSLDRSASSVGNDASALGIAIDEYTGVIEDKNGDLAGAGEKLADEMARSGLAAIEKYQLLGESAADTFGSLADTAESLTESFKTTGVSLSNKSSGWIDEESSRLADAYSADLAASQEKLKQVQINIIGQALTGHKSGGWRDEELRASIAEQMSGLGGFSDAYQQIITEAFEDSLLDQAATIKRTEGRIETYIDPILANISELNSRIDDVYNDAVVAFNQGIVSSIADIKNIDTGEAEEAFGALASSYAENYLTEVEQLASTAKFAKQEFLSLGFSEQDLDASTEAVKAFYEAASSPEEIANALVAADALARYNNAIEASSTAAEQAAAAERERLQDMLSPYLQNLADWSSEELSRIESDYQERIALAEEQYRIGRELRQYVEQLKISELSPYDPSEKLELATEQFAALLVKAESGDMDAAGQLQSAANAYLQNADSYYGRSDPYTSIFEEVTQSLDRMGLDIMGGLDEDSVEKLTAQMLSEQQRIRDYASEQLTWTVSQYSALTSIEQLLGVLPESLASQLNTVTGTAASSSATESLILSQWDQMGGGTYSDSDLSRYASQVDSGATDMGQINQELAYYQSNNSKIMDQVLDAWNASGGGDYNDADLARYAADIAAGKGELSAADLEHYRATHGSHAAGLNSVPFDGYKAELHKNEMVLTADVANHIRESMSAGSKSSQVIVQTDPALLAEIQQLRAEVAQFRSERAQSASKAEQQRSDQQRATESVARAAKTPVGVL
ncbi:hypothetical protein [Oceanospirillum maris]|uniref:hypothetical protein n=1 Tax=Oceanospirillum maris TaxID=64977 RepID=UPI0003F4C118|nr:hypothetical protein [Oceanospirillum maris]